MLKIAKWDSLFENNRSRQIETLTWVPMPNSHDGAGYLELLDHKAGAAHYGCWALIVQVASKCRPRGALVRSNGIPHTAESLARQVRTQPNVMREAIRRLLQVGWLQEDGQDGGTTASGERQVGVTSTSVGRQEGGIEGRKEGRKEVPPLSPPTSGGLCSTEKNPKSEKGETAKARALYDLYPRHVAPERAIRAILTAMKKAPYEQLEAAVRAYAVVRRQPGRDPGQTPYPATWFNGGRYSDDPKEWERPDVVAKGARAPGPEYLKATEGALAPW